MSATVDAPAGRMRGSADGGVRVFRGIPYAEPPVGARRFAPPVAVPPFAHERDCTRNGPIPPQRPSRLKDVIGDFGGPQSEDCLSLNVWAPEAEGEPRPVMVFVHGGAHVSGAASLPCYDAARLARDGDVVVVSPNFRLGALGLLYLPGVCQGNLALHDLVVALHWVRDNIRAFGGDPAQVTLFGQSSGASDIRALMAMPVARGLFHRAILQSAPLGRPDRDPSRAAEIGRRYAGLLGLAPDDREGFEQASVDAMLGAQAALARSFRMPLGTNELPFTPVVDGETVLDDASGNWFADAAAGHAALVGFNAHEMAAFHAIDPAVASATRDQALESLRQMGVHDAESVYTQAAASRGAAATPAGVLCDVQTARQFGAPAVAYARSLARRGVRTWQYRFDWPSPVPGLGACHCLELPFVLDNFEGWEGAPMLAGRDSAVTRQLAGKMLRAWASFARTGSPGHEGLRGWPALPAEQLMVFDAEPRLEAAGFG